VNPSVVLCLLGVSLGAGVVAGKLLGSTVAHDVDTLCDAEVESGFALRKNVARVTEWLEERLKTPEGNRLLTTMRDLPIDRRAEWLEQRARALGRIDCPLSAAYRDVSARWAVRERMQVLCSSFTFPGIGALDDAMRPQFIDEWFEASWPAGGPNRLRARLLEARTGAERADVLRSEARGSGLLSCDLARTLGAPPVRACTPAP
jgi:hypothetical protein